MYDKLGVFGVVGLVLLLGGIALVATQNLYIAAGIALVLAGLGLLVRGLLSWGLGAMGMGGLI